MKHFGLLLVVLAACGSDTRPLCDAAVDAETPDASLDAALDATPIDASVPDAMLLPEAYPNYGARCFSEQDCEADGHCEGGVCRRSCTFGFSCEHPSQTCYGGMGTPYCAWECPSDVYSCPTGTYCTPFQSGYVCV